MTNGQCLTTNWEKVIPFDQLDLKHTWEIPDRLLNQCHAADLHFAGCEIQPEVPEPVGNWLIVGDDHRGRDGHADLIGCQRVGAGRVRCVMQIAALTFRQAPFDQDICVATAIADGGRVENHFVDREELLDDGRDSSVITSLRSFASPLYRR